MDYPLSSRSAGVAAPDVDARRHTGRTVQASQPPAAYTIRPMVRPVCSILNVGVYDVTAYNLLYQFVRGRAFYVQQA